MENSNNQITQNINRIMKDSLGLEQDFSMLVSSKPYRMDEEVYRAYESRYKTIDSFLRITNRLVYESLCEGKHKDLYKLLFFGKDNEYTQEQRNWYQDNPDSAPLFFRTDEPVPGKIVEIQCPGSGLGQLALLEAAWNKALGRRLWPDAMKNFAGQIKDMTGKGSPKMIYLPKSSFPEDVHLIYRLLEKQGIELLNTLESGTGYKDEITRSILAEADFLRIHSYGFLRTWPAFWDAVSLHKDKKLIIDVPPAIIFNMKLIMALPFHDRFKHHYNDDIRALFPHTSILEKDGRIEHDGKMISYDEYLELPDKGRRHIIKSSTGNSELDDGGKGVFSLKRTTRQKCKDMFKRIILEYHYGERWIIQEEVNRRYDFDFMDAGGSVRSDNGYARFSGFYGPGGLIARRALFKNFYKVGGSSSTVCAPVMRKGKE